MSTKGATREGVLSPKQLRFIDEYLVDLNARAAAIRAGYSKKTAAEMGYENLRKPHIALAIEAKRKELAVATGNTVERVIKEMAAIAFSDVRKLFNEQGGMIDLKSLPDDIAPAIASIEVTSFTPPGEGSKTEWTKKVRFWDKGKQLENLLKHLGMDKDKDQAAPATGAALPGLEPLLEKLNALIPGVATA